MIIWLASYPKSGNTWVRLFLDSLLNTEINKIDLNNIKITQFPLRKNFDGLNINIDNIEEFVSNCIVAQEKINLDNSVKIFKTHNAFWKAGHYAFTNEVNTKGVIYIVRDPRNVITSLKNHYSQNNDEAFNMMINDKAIIGSKKNKTEKNLPTVLSSWSNHYNSWKKMNKNYLLIKYENLLNNTYEEFSKIAVYMNNHFGLNLNKKEIEEAIETCNFENLKKLEIEHGFNESAKDKRGNPKKFFFLGPKNNWENILDNSTKERLEKVFKKEMLELGYL